MPSRNLILFIINRGEKILLVKQTGKKRGGTLWALPGGYTPLKYGLTHAAYRYLRPYFRDLAVIKVKYIRPPVQDMTFGNERGRLIPIECTIRGTVKKKARHHTWFVRYESLVHHVVVPGTMELLGLPEIQSRLA